MKNTFWILSVVLIAVFATGCSGGGEDEGSNKELIDKANKALPPADPNAKPHIPVREDMGGGNMPQKGGK